MVSIVEVVTKPFNTNERLQELRDFVDSKRSNLGSAGKTLSAAIDATAFNLDWVQNNGQVIAIWLRDHLEREMMERLYYRELK